MKKCEERISGTSTRKGAGYTEHRSLVHFRDGRTTACVDRAIDPIFRSEESTVRNPEPRAIEFAVVQRSLLQRAVRRARHVTNSPDLSARARSVRVTGFSRFSRREFVDKGMKDVRMSRAR